MTPSRTVAFDADTPLARAIVGTIVVLRALQQRLSGRAARLGLGLGAALWLAGCASGPPIDTSYQAKSQGPRVDLLIIHYTVIDFPTSLRVLTQEVVSSHYLVDVDPPTIYRLVDENRRANHAGVSYWERRHLLNMSSIGIEIVNRGYVDGPNGRVYTPYPPKQIDAVVALVRDIVKRWNIPPERVIGHADIAPGRKQDPGPLFPWKRLADEGLALWFDEAQVAALRPHFEQQLPDLAWFRERLAKVGYHVPFAPPPAVTQAAPPAPAGPLAGSTAGATAGATATPAPVCTVPCPVVDTVLDPGLRDVLISFQMHFRPARYDGQPDAETAAILAALTSR
jgi:N-acetylmuramoyl-L-alanine amidase